MKPETTDGLKALSCWANRGELQPRRRKNLRGPGIYSDKGINSAKAAATETAVQRAKGLAATRRLV
jgi:hypothetical protein